MQDTFSSLTVRKLLSQTENKVYRFESKNTYKSQPNMYEKISLENKTRLNLYVTTQGIANTEFQSICSKASNKYVF